jgi:ABC-type branched-subunit amino acid transport system substrate-binding protein
MRAAGGGGVRFRLKAALAAALLLAACGQKAGVGGPDTAAAPVPAASAATVTTGTAPPADPLTSPTAVAAPVAGGTTGLPAQQARSGPTAPTGRSALAPGSSIAAAAAGGPAAPSSGAARSAAAGPAKPASPTTTGPGAVAAPAAGPHDRDGVSDKEIVIGIHAPITGAAPVPEDSVDKAKDLYWKWLADRGGILGRNVRIVLRDDQYNPSRAVTVCRELVEQEHAFLLIGVGTDQVVSCARYASQAGVPYISSGGGEAAVAGLANYFAISMSFPQQAPLVAQVVKRTGKTKVAVVVINTPNYDDTFTGLVQSAKDAGLTVVRADRLGKQASQSEVLAEANNLRTSGAEAVMLMLAPVTFLDLAHSAQGQAYTPLWVGPGMSNGLNLVAEFGCPSIAGARFLSPFPQLDVSDRFDADYKPAYRKYNNGAEPDDLGLLVWGMSKTLHRFLAATGPDLGRAKFMATLESGQEFNSGVFPPLRYGPGHHFGANQVNLLEADCGTRKYRTLATFTSSF